MTGGDDSTDVDRMMSLRVGYQAPPLLEQDLAPSPLGQFRRWFADAVAAGIPEPNAMSLATIGPDGPGVRMILAKSVRADGIQFFTNKRSRKGRDIEYDPRVAACFAWITQHRQVVFRGSAEELDRGVALQYFRGRPRDARIGAWASDQSAPIESRDLLRQRAREATGRFAEEVDVPMPDAWGGYLIRVSSVEFWQGQPSRLHDRLRFVARSSFPWLDHSGAWAVERLQP